VLWRGKANFAIKVLFEERVKVFRERGCRRGSGVRIIEDAVKKLVGEKGETINSRRSWLETRERGQPRKEVREGISLPL
jgi:hypothetical protein